jgi:hypothetical protein
MLSHMKDKILFNDYLNSNTKNFIKPLTPHSRIKLTPEEL